jgi:membrane-bound ClpP family serine protease
MEFIMEPTLVYLLLMLGLWMGATSFFIPGTGFGELGAVVFIGGSLWALGQMGANWASVLLLIIGVAAFIIIPLAFPKYTRYAEIALIPQVVGAFFLYEKVTPNITVIVATTVAAFAWNRFLLVPLMNKMRVDPAVGDEVNQLLGVEGRVTSAVNPPNAGTAYINGESWTVRSDEALAVNDIVIVIETRGLEAFVEKIKAKSTPDEA